MSISSRPSSNHVRLFVAQSGPKTGSPDCIAAFKSMDAAVEFLTDLHGLEFEEARRLRRQMFMPLKRRVHGAEHCSILEEEMTRLKAQKALTGELYLKDAPRVLTPKKINKPLKLAITIRPKKQPRRQRLGRVASSVSKPLAATGAQRKPAAKKPAVRDAKPAVVKATVKEQARKATSGRAEAPKRPAVKSRPASTAPVKAPKKTPAKKRPIVKPTAKKVRGTQTKQTLRKATSPKTKAQAPKRSIAKPSVTKRAAPKPALAAKKPAIRKPAALERVAKRPSSRTNVKAAAPKVKKIVAKKGSTSTRPTKKTKPPIRGASTRKVTSNKVSPKTRAPQRKAKTPAKPSRGRKSVVAGRR